MSHLKVVEMYKTAICKHFFLSLQKLILSENISKKYGDDNFIGILCSTGLKSSLKAINLSLIHI